MQFSRRDGLTTPRSVRGSARKTERPPLGQEHSSLSKSDVLSQDDDTDSGFVQKLHGVNTTSESIDSQDGTCRLKPFDSAH